MLAAAAVVCPHPTARARCCVYVSGGKGSMGLCLECKGAMEGLIRRCAGLGDVVSTLLGLDYTRQDAARFHADMAPRGPRRLWRRLVNPALVMLAPQPAMEAVA